MPGVSYPHLSSFFPSTFKKELVILIINLSERSLMVFEEHEATGNDKE